MSCTNVFITCVITVAVPHRVGGLAGIWSSVQWVRHSLSRQPIIYHLQLWKRSSWTPGTACQWVYHFSAVQSCCSTVSIIITLIISDRETGTCKCPQLLLVICRWHFCCHAVVVKTALQAHTMGRPGAAHVPARWPRPVPSYFAIVNIFGDGGQVSLTVILRSYLYGKHQLEGDGIKM